MIKPTREMFEDGPEGDKAFRDFLGIYNTLGQEDLLTDRPPPRTSIIDPTEEKEIIRQEFETEKAKTKQADISKFKVTDPNKIEVEELPPANQENKQDTDQEPDVFEESGVEPMFQSASLASNDKFIKRIMDDEGKPFLEATKVFDDEKNFTIGYGRNNANIKKGDKITLEQAQKNLAEDVEIRLEEIQDLIPNFSRFSNELQLALFSEYYRGSVRQSPKTVKLINEGKFREAAAEFLNNDEYRNAVKKKKLK